MKTLDQLLRSLGREDVEEVTLVSGRLPCARVGTSFDPIDDEPLSTDSILAMLVAAGGSRYVDTLGPSAKEWGVRAPGVGMVKVHATQRGNHVEARLKLAQRPAQATKRASEHARRGPSGTPSSSKRGASVNPSRRPPSVSRMNRPDSVASKALKAGGRAATTPTRPDVPKPSLRPKASESARASARPKAPESAPQSARARASEPPATPKLSERFRRAQTAPAMPRAIRLSQLPPPPADPGADKILPRAHVRVRATSPGHAAWRPEAETMPGASAVGDTDGAPQSAPAFSPVVGPELRALLGLAREAGASDLHVVSGRAPMLRVGGELRPRGEPIVAEAVERMFRPLVPPRLARNFEGLGSCDFAIELDGQGRFRVNLGLQHTGLKACLRLIPRELPTLQALKLPPDITRAAAFHQGLVLFTGPTGHGKTTTMTAVVDHINQTTNRHIITVEDPVENVHPKKRALISQREVGTHTASFSSALRAALREDPDVIVVGELRDVETVRMAVAASETGHLVLGTMNTPSAAKSIDRVIDLFPPADQPQVRLTLASGLRLIVGQRLVPSQDRSRVHCAVELLPASIPLSAIIRDNKTYQIPSLQQRGKGVGIVRLDESIADLVRTGRVALADAMAAAESPAELEAALKTRPHASPAGATS